MLGLESSEKIWYNKKKDTSLNSTHYFTLKVVAPGIKNSSEKFKHVAHNII